MIKFLPLLFLIFILWGCKETVVEDEDSTLKSIQSETLSSTSIVVLGTLQDAGSPHIGCIKDCCKDLFDNPDPLRQVVSLGVYDASKKTTYLFEATPDISTQVKALKNITNTNNELPDGIFLTHAHIGHYTGLMYLGKEATNAPNISVFAMPKMKTFLETNGPWSQLVTTKNIAITKLKNNTPLILSEELSVIPFTVPHRDEFSETVGYIIKGPSKSVLFIPDIDKWSQWETSISEAISKVDYAFIDATFYSGDELNTRDISQIPHPFVIESMELFKNLPASEKKKIHFIHFNHTNPLLDSESDPYKNVLSNGFNIAQINSVFKL
jgi:pyrroloquinoline quinone biosynthesis protein B